MDRRSAARDGAVGGDTACAWGTAVRGVVGSCSVP